MWKSDHNSGFERAKIKENILPMNFEDVEFGDVDREMAYTQFEVDGFHRFHPAPELSLNAQGTTVARAYF